MQFTTTLLSAILLASTALAGPVAIRGHTQGGSSHDMDSSDMDDSFNIFKDSAERYEGAICKDQINTSKFPNLLVPAGRSGCVRCK